MKTSSLPLTALRLANSLLLATLLGSQALAEVISDPLDNTANVPISKQVTFVFDTFIDTERTRVYFYDFSAPSTPLPITTNWTSAGMMLACKPSPSWPAGAIIIWSIDGVDFPDENPIEESGIFFTAGSSGGGDTGTNAVTSFILESVHFHTQSNSISPIIDPDMGYLFYGLVSLASNRTANTVSLAIPTGRSVDLESQFFAPEDFTYLDSTNNLSVFNTNYPGGTYTFTLSGSTGTDIATVTFSAPSNQPNAPRVSNFTEAQAINASQPFTVHWDAFTNGSASDHISLQIEPIEFYSPDFDEPGALTGTARSFTIPAGTLASNTTYTANLTFFRHQATTNANEVKAAVRASQTEFTLTTTGTKPPAGPIQFVSPTLLPNGSFSCEIKSDPGQSMKILASTTLLTGSWSPILTTNSPSGSITFTDGPLAPGQHRYYKVEAN